MIHQLGLALALQSAVDVSPKKMEIPDPDTVTTIEAAAETCLLTELNIDWQKVDENKIKINFNASLMKDKQYEKKMNFTLSVLKYCFFEWAYDRKVTVVFDGGQKSASETEKN